MSVHTHTLLSLLVFRNAVSPTFIGKGCLLSLPPWLEVPLHGACGGERLRRERMVKEKGGQSGESPAGGCVGSRGH